MIHTTIPLKGITRSKYGISSCLLGSSVLSSFRIGRDTFSTTRVCNYATTPDIDHHKRLDLHKWPDLKNPDPHEIFNIKPSDFGVSQLEMNKILKLTYGKYVKLYHPDVSHKMCIRNHKGVELTTNMKRMRFDQVQSAYDILKDPRRRVAFKRYAESTWDDPKFKYTRPAGGEHFSKQNFDAYRRAHAHRQAYSFTNNEKFWQAGTWEDYYRMKYKRQPPTKEELDKNKYKILFGVVLVGAIAFILQVLLAIERANEHLRQLSIVHLKNLRDLELSYDNYGGGDTQFERLQRFLTSRRSSIYVNDQNEGGREEDYDLLTKYARQRVEKWMNR